MWELHGIGEHDDAAAEAAPAPDECRLLSGGFAALMQVLLGFIAMSVLVLKRHREVPRRPLPVWALDASKQLVGAGFAHVANLFVALVLYERGQGHDHGPSSGVDQCAFYFVNFTLDTTFGVLLNWGLLLLMSALAARLHWTSLATPGEYGDPVRLQPWLAQLSAWLLVILLAKLVVAVFIVLLETPLAAMARWLFAPLQGSPHLELALVMIACPCLMNALQFWLQDSFLKKDVRAECALAATKSPAMDKAARRGDAGSTDEEDTRMEEDEQEEAEEEEIRKQKQKQQKGESSSHSTETSPDDVV